MNKAQRFLALTGMSIAAGAMIGMGPVQAAPSAGQSSTGGSTAGRVSAFGEHVVGYYRTEWSCERAGYTGKRFRAWYDFDCDPIRYGWRGWVFQLVVDDNDWGWDDWRGSWPGGWPYRPDFVGQPFHVRGGHGRPPSGPHGRPPFDGPRGDRDDDRDRPMGDRDRDRPTGDRDRDRPMGDRDGDRNRDRPTGDRDGDRDRDRPTGDRDGDRDRPPTGDRDGDRDGGRPPRDGQHPATWPRP
ncbi:hypothetical protein Acy02nite_27020 [Actinoplanes cyaneus]|uniref:Uncharacterized protein n=1 Tax=Actinoplanes cyaneus TaxID=52696 RepID=A0A919MB78_9ACTN|nr:hypothetical protein [Actinoplanes cyaneus]MCW2137971.1 hypothetical protein [Actinoplanes cyaneus]GID64821.1 hypothetical protein Acy02nite_27020 [Actinoplanes cyaneus]